MPNQNAQDQQFLPQMDDGVEYEGDNAPIITPNAPILRESIWTRKIPFDRKIVFLLIAIVVMCAIIIFFFR